MSTQKRFWVPDDDDCGKNKRQKTAIEQEMEEAEEYELRKETEQRRVQQLKLLSLDHQLRKTQASTDRRSRARARLVLERESKTSRLSKIDGGASDGTSDASNDMRLNPISMTKPVQSTVTIRSESASNRMVDLKVTSSEDGDATHLARNTLSKLRLPRSLLEKWVEEPFFEKAVVGCFVRLGVGKSPGLRGEPQYKVCEIISVDEYKHAYAFGEFETTKALMLRIGRNQRLWRMNVISNHRFTDTELEE